jgi:hypothetical protein
MRTEDISAGKARPASKADNLTAICEKIVFTMWDLHNTIGLHGLIQGKLSYYYYY